MSAVTPAFVAVDWNGTVVPWFGEAPYARALTVLAALREQGVFVAVVSHATPGEIGGDVERVGLAVDEVHGVRFKGPVLEALRARFGADGCMIGDSPQDARAAASVGLPFLQARFGDERRLEGALGFLEDWDELPALLEAVRA